MRRKALAIASVALIAGCSTVPEGSAEFVRLVDVDYARFGACALRAFENTWPTDTKYLDLRGEEAIRVSLEVTTNGPLGVLTVRQLEVYVRKAGENKARVEVRARAGSWPGQAWSRIESCARPA
jgi:hypothetical protein